MRQATFPRAWTLTLEMLQYIASYPESEIEGTTLVLYTRYAFIDGVDAELGAPSDSDTAPQGQESCQFNCISAGPVLETVVGRDHFLNTNKLHTLCHFIRFRSRSGRGLRRLSLFQIA